MSGTEVFFRDFFPDAQQHLSDNWPKLWSLLQPAWMASTCPEQQVVVELPLWGWVLGAASERGAHAATAAAPPAPLVLHLRNPSLLPFQLLGLAVALFGLRCLAGCRRRCCAYLWHSLAFFGGMNLSSIVCHALAARGTLLWQAALHADVAFTGASSLCVLYSQMLPPPSTAVAALRRCWVTLALLLAASVAGSTHLQLPWVSEAIYLGTTALACAACAHRLLWRWVAAGTRQRARLQPRLALAALGCGMMLLCLPLDPVLCAMAGPLLGTVHMLFAGSALSFAALVLLSRAEGGAEGAAAEAAGARGAASTKAD